MKKFAKIFIFCMLLMFSFTIIASGAETYVAETYVADEVKVLKSDTINTLNNNLGNIDKNTQVKIKFNIVKTLAGKDIVTYGKQYASSNIKDDKYLLFIVSIGDRKNKLIAGPGVNSILSESEIKAIETLPNDSFKANKIDEGILTVCKALDQKVTTKAVKTGKAEVKTDGYSTTVKPKTNYLGIFLTLILIIGIAAIVIYCIRKHINNSYENKKKKIYEDAGMSDYLENNATSFRSTSTSMVKPSAPPVKTVYEEKIYEETDYDSPHLNNYARTSYTVKDRRAYREPTHTTINKTVYVDNSRRDNGSDFVEGMVMGSMMNELSHNHHHEEEHHHHHNDSYREPERTHYEEPTTYQSNNYESSGTSWDSTEIDTPSFDSGGTDW